MDYSIIIPVYMSFKRIYELVDRIGAIMEQEAPGNYELILVNDCSPDSVTWPAIKQKTEEYTWVRGVDLLNNVGQFRALMCGMENARGQYIITMDDDLQHPPEELPKLIHTLASRPDIDCVIGAYREKKHSWFRNLGSAWMALLNQYLYDSPRELKRSSFRIMRRSIADAICAHTTVKPIIGPLILQSTKRIINVEIEHHARVDGESGYSFMRLFRITVDNLISFSTIPLKFVTVIGLLSAAGSFALGTYYLIRHLVGAIQMPGFATIVLLIVFFGGMTLLAVGILGEYVIRVIHEVSRPPRYSVRERAGHYDKTAMDVEKYEK